MKLEIQIRLSGAVETVEPLEAVGLAIRCRLPATPQRLETPLIVLPDHAVDQEAFWSAWERLGGQEQGLVWESGQPFRRPGAGPETPPTRSWRVVRWLRWLADWLERRLN